jgi:adenylosuccinate lyase
MMEAVKAGAGREDAHSAIKEHAVATVRDLREGKIKENDLVTRLANDSRVGLEKKLCKNSSKPAREESGPLRQQVEHFVKRANKWGRNILKLKAILRLPFCKSFIFAEFAPLV